MQDELSDHNFMVVSVCVQEDLEGARDFADKVAFPTLHDRDHLLTELLAISNVPTGILVEADGRVAQPNTALVGTDTFKDFTGIDSSEHIDLVRQWVLSGNSAVDAQTAAADAVGTLSTDEVKARLHFRIGAHLLRAGDDAGGRQHMQTAATLAPNDFTIRRAAMPLLGDDPFGDGFFKLWGEWQEGGRQYHGLSVAQINTA